MFSGFLSLIQGSYICHCPQDLGPGNSSGFGQSPESISFELASMPLLLWILETKLIHISKKFEMCYFHPCEAWTHEEIFSDCSESKKTATAASTSK
jgi:hypothetical protein